MRAAIVAVCVVLAGAPAFAQGAGGGVMVGVNIANVKADVGGGSINLDSRNGIIAGGFAVIPVASHFAIEPGAFYSTQGAKLKDIEFFGSGTVKLTYLQVPVLARVTAPLAPSTGLRVFAGPSFGFRLSAKARAAGETEDTNIEEDFESFDMGAVFGGGIVIGPFIADARYTMSLRNIAKTLQDAPDGESVKNRVFSIMAGIKF
jgi:hypothetical protein